MAYKAFILCEEDGYAGVDFTDSQRDQHYATALLLGYQGDIVDFTGRLDNLVVTFLLCKGYLLLGMHNRARFASFSVRRRAFYLLYILRRYSCSSPQISFSAIS